MPLLNIFRAYTGKPFDANAPVESIEYRCDVCGSEHCGIPANKLINHDGFVTVKLPCGHEGMFIHEAFMSKDMRTAYRAVKYPNEAIEKEKQRQKEIANAKEEAHKEHIIRTRKCCANCANVRHILLGDSNHMCIVTSICTYDLDMIKNHKLGDPDIYSLDIERRSCGFFAPTYKCYMCEKTMGVIHGDFMYVPKHPKYGFDMDAEYICDRCAEILKCKMNLDGTLVPTNWMAAQEMEDEDEED